MTGRPAPPRPRGLGRLASPQALARLAAAAGLFPVAGLLLGRHWFFDLFNHFQAQYFAFLLLSCLGLLAWRRPRLALVPALLLVLPAWRLAPLYLPGSSATDEASLRVATFNVLTRNERFGEVIEWIRRTDPDFLYLPETNERWNRQLESLDDDWPHHLDHPVAGNFGFSFRSKHPILADHTRDLGLLEIPLMELVVETPHGPVTVLGAHPVPPVNGLWSRERDGYLAELARVARDHEGRLVLLGDLNATRWSRAMRPLLSETPLHDTAEGHGFSATWHRVNPLAAIPIDHILVQGFTACVSRSTGPDLGSDHRPVVAELAW